MKIIIIGLVISTLFFCGCLEFGEYQYKTGVIVNVRSYSIGGTFSDREHELTYKDGSKLYIVGYEHEDKFICNITSTICYQEFEYEGIKYNRLLSIDYGISKLGEQSNDKKN